MTSVLFLFYQSCRHPHHNSAIRTAAAISYKCFAKPTIILSYPFVYWFKPICYVMIVAILNYHSSVITIMVKNDNFLCVNCTIKTGTVREQMRNLLKRLLFSSRQAFLLSKTACKAAWDPGVPIMETRVRERCRPGSVRDLYGGVGMFIRHVRSVFMPCFCIFFKEKSRFIFKRPRFVNAILVRLACHFPPSFSDKADYFLFL